MQIEILSIEIEMQVENYEEVHMQRNCSIAVGSLN